MWMFGMFATSAQAAAPNQELQRQQERERVLREEMEPAPDVRLPSSTVQAIQRLPESETPCFTIREIALKSDTPVFDWAVQAASLPDDPATGRCLGGSGINLVMQRIQNAIIERGFVTTRVLAEAQDLNSGILTLTVIPGRIRSIRFSEDSNAQANALNAVPAKPGDLLNLRDIEQALENFKRLPTVEADIQIAPADDPGESDLVISWKQAFPLRLTLSANDGGSKATGKNIGTVTVSGDNLLALNDLFYISYNRDIGVGNGGERGTQGNTVHYSVPWGYWLLSATGSNSDYHQSVAGASQNYIYSGTSANYDLKLSRLIYRDAANKTTASFRGYLTESNNYIDDTEVEVQRRRMAGWGAELAHRAFISDATLDLSLAYRQGTGAFGALNAPEEAFDEGLSRAKIVSYELGLALPFKLADQPLRYNGNIRGQWSQSPLAVSTDRFSIGGRYTVRGFDGESVLVSESGWTFRNDLSVPLGESGQEFYVGLDHGQVYGKFADLLVGKRLTGAVLGLRGSVKDVSYDLFVGQPVSKPEGFVTASVTAGFNLSVSF